MHGTSHKSAISLLEAKRGYNGGALSAIGTERGCKGEGGDEVAVSRRRRRDNKVGEKFFFFFTKS
jgi:hypothetical protein